MRWRYAYLVLSVGVLSSLIVLPVGAQDAQTLPTGSAVIYGGAGLTTLNRGLSGVMRDRQIRGRTDVYAAYGVMPKLELAVDIPIVHDWVLENPDYGPCPRQDDYCDPILSLGDAGLFAKYRFLANPLVLSGVFGALTDVWNARTREQWNNAGQGTNKLVLSLLLGHPFEVAGVPVGIDAQAYYEVVFGRVVDYGLGPIDVPADGVGGSLRAEVRFKRFQIHAVLSALSSLYGENYDSETYGTYYASTVDRWAVLKYQEVKSLAKFSYSLSAFSGLHLSVGRLLWVHNGPPGAIDVSLGIHRWFPPRRKPSRPR